MKGLLGGLVAAVMALSLLGCDRHPLDRLRVIDLLKQVGNAEKRPVHETFDIVDHGCGDERHMSLAVPAVSRVIWSTKLPDRPVFVSHVALDGPPGASALFRVGVSDDRIYEQLETRTVTVDECGNGWTTIEVDLGRYAGWQFSLFYRPSRTTWRLVLGVNAATGPPSRAFWGVPRIETDSGAAKKFYRGQSAAN